MFGSYEFLRLGVSNSYIWKVRFVTFWGYEFLRLGVSFLRLGVSNFYVWGLDFFRLEVRFLTFGG